MKAGHPLVALLLLLAAGADERRAFSLAVLRRDGLVVPFAAFDGRRWRAQWPADVGRQELPITLDAVPKGWWGLEQRPEKLAWWRDGVRAGDVTITGLTTTRLMCQPRLVLRSDYKVAPPVPPPFERPYPNDGLLVAGAATVTPIAAVGKGSDAWNEALALLPARFNEAESDAAREFSHWRHPVREQDRRRVPITLEALYTAPMDVPGWTASFVEAVRQFPPAPDDKDGCGLVTYASGWILTDPKQKAVVRLTARITYCDRYGARYMLPLGMVPADGKHYWIFQISGYEAEWYEVLRPTPRALDSHVAYLAGTCNPDRD